jgi:hypothetical protein
VSGLRVVGVGGAGLAAVDRLIGEGRGGFVAAALDRDRVALARSLATLKLQLPPTGPAEEDDLARELGGEVRRMMQESDSVCIVGGLGGGTSSIALPKIVRMAAELGKPPLVVVAKPRSGEGRDREATARLSLARCGGAAVLLVALPAELLEADAAADLLARILRRIAAGLPEGRPSAADLTRISAGLTSEFAALRSAGIPFDDWLRTPAVEVRAHRLGRTAFLDLPFDSPGPEPAGPGTGGLAPARPAPADGPPARARRAPTGRPRFRPPARGARPGSPPREDAAPAPEPPVPGETERTARAPAPAVPPPASRRPQPAPARAEAPTDQAGTAPGESAEHGATVLSTAVPDVSFDVVHFTVTTPAAVAPGTHFLLTLWAHLEGQRTAVLERARDEQATRDIRVQGKGPIHIARGTFLTVRLRLHGLDVDDPEDAILWEGEIGNASFPVFVPADARPGAVPGVLTVHADGLRTVKVHFLVNVGAGQNTVAAIPADVELHRKAFASYASQDRDAVLARVQGMQKVLPHLKVFIDVVELRSGQNWADQLALEIPRNDVFYLFWSDHARRSQWVEKEWRCAFAAKGVEFIDPVPLVPPDRVPPPAELASRHFNDWHLAFMSRPVPQAT